MHDGKAGASRLGEQSQSRMVAEARSELPFSHPVPKTLGAVSITLCCPVWGLAFPSATRDLYNNFEGAISGSRISIRTLDIYAPACHGSVVS